MSFVQGRENTQNASTCTAPFEFLLPRGHCQRQQRGGRRSERGQRRRGAAAARRVDVVPLLLAQLRLLDGDGAGSVERRDSERPAFSKVGYSPQEAAWVGLTSIWMLLCLAQP